MKKLLMMLLVLMCLPAMAEQRTADEAQNVAMNYLRANKPRHMQGVNSQAPQLSLAMTALSTENEVDYYVFNNVANRGFVIVSGDDQAAPVIGYSDEGTFDVNDIPDGLRFMLDCYAEQMHYVRLHPEAAYINRAPANESTIYITPLLSTNWNQNSPYNDLCPTFGEEGTRAAVGCVATAAAQVMNYYKWPKQGTGEFTYVCNVGGKGEQTLSADFGSTTYDWENMLDDYIPGSYTEAEGKAVATLMSHVGIAAHMEYGSSSSTATFAAMEALREYFGYNQGMRAYTRNCVPNAQWDSLIMNELLNSRPILYTGSTYKRGGHCFVLDGIDAQGYYHFNWGWGGKSNGYFLITMLNPSDQGIGSFEGGYNSSQEFIANVYPDQGEPAPDRFMEATCLQLWSSVDHVNLGQKAPINFKHLHFNCYGYGLSAEISIGLLLADLSGNIVNFTSNNTLTKTFNFGSNYTYTDEHVFNFNTPATIADGYYRLWFVYKVLNSEMVNYAYLNNIPELPRFIDVKVQDGVMYFSSAITDKGKLSVVDLIAPPVVGAENKLNVTATVANAGKEYFNNVYFALINANNEYKIYDAINIDVVTGGRVTFTSMITAPSTPGEYTLAVLDKDLERIDGSVSMTVQESSNYELNIASQLQVSNYYMDVDNVSGTAVLGNSGTGDYVGAIPFMILSNDGKYVKFSGNTDVVSIPAGGTATVNIKTTFEGTPGLAYRMCLRALSTPNQFTIWGDQVPFEVNSVHPTTKLYDVLAGGVVDITYRLADNLTVVDTHEQSLFATNGRGSWVEVKCGDYYNQVAGMKAFKAGTVWGKYGLNNDNPFITLTKLPEEGMVQNLPTNVIDLSQPLTPVPDEVIDFSGFYRTVDGKPMISAYEGLNGDMGQMVPIAFDWLESFAPMTEGKCYDLHGVIMLTPATSGASSLRAGTTSANYTVYLTKEPVPSFSTDVANVNSDAVKISVADGVISVAGAHRVAVYNVAGALVGTGDNVRLPAGIYIVIADGKMRKVAVR